MVKGRYWLGLWLVFYLAVLVWVVARQTSAVLVATELRNQRDQRLTLEGRRGELLRRIREGRSRSTLIPRAEALGLRLPADSEIVILQVTPPVTRP